MHTNQCRVCPLSESALIKFALAALDCPTIVDKRDTPYTSKVCSSIVIEQNNLNVIVGCFDKNNFRHNVFTADHVPFNCNMHTALSI